MQMNGTEWYWKARTSFWAGLWRQVQRQHVSWGWNLHISKWSKVHWTIQWKQVCLKWNSCVVFSVSFDFISSKVQIKFTQHGSRFLLLPVKLALGIWDCWSQLYPFHKISQKSVIHSQSEVFKMVIPHIHFLLPGLWAQAEFRETEQFRPLSELLFQAVCLQMHAEIQHWFVLIVCEVCVYLFFEVKYKFQRDGKCGGLVSSLRKKYFSATHINIS